MTRGAQWWLVVFPQVLLLPCPDVPS